MTKAKQATLNGKTYELEPECSCGLKRPWDSKYHYPNCPWLKWSETVPLEMIEHGKKLKYRKLEANRSG